MIKDVAAGDIDAAAVWGPIAGYYAAKTQAAADGRAAHQGKGRPRMTFRITMGVRPSDQEWKRQLNKVISENQTEINDPARFRRAAAGRAGPADYALRMGSRGISE